MISPDNQIKCNWDLFITFVLLFSCAVTPYRLAFVDPEDESFDWFITNTVIDVMFLLDIILTFFTAFYDQDFVLVINRK